MAVERRRTNLPERRIMKRFLSKFILVLAMCFLLAPVTSYAAASTGEMGQFPNVSLSPDGTKRAWTTDLWDKTNEMLPLEYTIDMNVPSSIGVLGVGEHYYGKQAVGSVPVGKWVVKHSPGQCIHGPTITKDTFAGFTYRNELCHSFYNNGWFAYCADCGEYIAHMLIYARESTVKQITSLPASSTYVFLCPHCTHLEQGHSYQHYCKAISSNRYRVTYRPNAPADSTVAGYMAPTMHMYDNSSTYNGEPASAIGYTDTTLRLSSYACEGYVFTGWNTKADGSGLQLSDGQEVLNLTTEDNGTVKLYAQWKKAEGSLILDANGGTFKGKSVYTQKQKYGTSYSVENGKIVPPAGYKVSFQTNGGSAVSTITSTKSFTHWEIQPGFKGSFKNDVYQFLGGNGNQDSLKAQYINNAFKLPDCTGSNASLVGWYDDPGLGDDRFVGKPGDEIIVTKDTTLYAKWATLTLWAYDDYDSHGGTGAVDLKWEQKDGKGKYYRLYQSEDKTSWKEIFSGNDIQSGTSISKSYGTSNQGTTYTIPYTGNYTLTAYGAKGADYDSTYTGGKGGKVTATYWLNKGDVITVYPGKSGSGLNGGSNGNGANGGSSTSDLGRGGGAATQIYLTRNGSKTLLITAGGGGGANANNQGGKGGSGGGNTTGTGANGVGAGGGGYAGGISGKFSYHKHGNSCGYHTHTGNSTNGGGCYGKPTTQSVPCGTFWEYETATVCWDEVCVNENGETYPGSGCAWVGSGAHCPGGYYDYHDYETYYAIECDNCGASGEVEGETHYKGVTVYVLDCGTAEGYLCGKAEGDIESCVASQGGTNYAANNFGCKNATLTAGANNGAGKVTISSEDIGYLDITKLNDVVAKDKAAPGKIQDYAEAMSGEDICRITVTKPDDFGTLYYHKVESYESGTVKKLATSNTTENTLTSGIAGYRYFVSSGKSGTVSASHTWTKNNWIDVTMTTSVRYLHVAAVDVAGNIGPTLHIKIKAIEDAPDIEPDPEYMDDVPLKTEQIVIQDTEFIHQAGTAKYYVKADGVTEHTMNIAGYTDGKASNFYQIDWLQMVSMSGTSQEWFQTRIPKVNTDAGDAAFANEELQTNASGEQLQYLEPTSAVAERTSLAQKVSLEQRFSIAPENDGKQIVVYPRAMAEYQEKEYWSDQNEDRTHSITLIPDGKAPVITGVDDLENAGNIDMTEASKDFAITATDDGSGVRKLVITITNLDNQMQRTYSSDTGDLLITMMKDDYLFLGDFVVSAEASDNVGNVNLQESESLAFSLEAELKKAREPYTDDFKAGDGVILTVTTGGYAEKVIIRFPDALIALNPGLNKEYVYEYPPAIKTEVYEFNIPLATVSGNYIVEVEAWKNGQKLTEELQLPVRTNGSITEELRTRIRDNGV